MCTLAKLALISRDDRRRRRKAKPANGADAARVASGLLPEGGGGWAAHVTSGAKTTKSTDAERELRVSSQRDLGRRNWTETALRKGNEEAAASGWFCCVFKRKQR